jgi:hypothetical protein
MSNDEKEKGKSKREMRSEQLKMSNGGRGGILWILCG